MGGNVVVRLNLNSTGYSAEMAKAQRAMQGFASATSAMGHGTVSQMQAASAAIRVLEGGMTGNIRAAERFISTIPGVGKALQAAFPLVGGIALAGVFVKIADEAAKAIQKVQQSEQAISNAFQSLNISGMLANDTLRVTNDRLENEIAKLQGKPQNNLAIAIDEARVAADKMAESLDRDNAKIKELLSQNAVPWWAGFLGKAGTSNVSDAINKQNQDLANLSNQAAVLQHTDPAAAAKIRAQIDAQRLQDIQDNAKDMAARQANQNLPGGLNQGANIAVDYGQQASLYKQIDQQDELKRNLADQATKQQLEDQKAQQEAAKRAAEAMKQAQELIVQQWRKNFDEAKADNDMTLAQEAQWWVQRMETAKKGSLSYIAALQEANKDIARMRSENMKGQGAFDQTSAGIYGAPEDLSKGDTGREENRGRQDAEYLRSLNQQIAAQRQAASAVAEQSLEMAVAAGQMSTLDAAQIQATMHTEDFQHAWERLQEALASAAQVPGEAGRTQVAGLNAQAAQMLGQRQMQIAQDQQRVASQQIGPAIQQALNEMVQNFNDMASTLKNVIPRTIDGLNNDLVKLATGEYKKGDVGKTLLGAGQGLLKTGLQGAEGRLLGSFGLGKRDGSSQLAALWVQLAGSTVGLSPSSSSVSAGVDLAKLIPGGSFIQPFIGGAQHGAGGAGGLLGTLLGSFLGKGAGAAAGSAGAVGGAVSAGDSLESWGSILQGAYEGGGDVVANRPALIGEAGPEIFTPKTAGTITPNSKLGGGDTHMHFNIQGNQDPMAVEAAIRRSAPHIAAASVQATHQNRMRSPGGR
jgi:hypothetical protein